MMTRSLITCVLAAAVAAGVGCVHDGSELVHLPGLFGCGAQCPCPVQMP